MTNQDGCTHLNDIVNTEITFIKRHLKEHKLRQHIEDDAKAKADFVKTYGLVMREMYCEHICSDRDNCETYKKYMEKDDS